MSNARYQIRQATWGDQDCLARLGEDFVNEFMPDLTYDHLSMSAQFGSWLLSNPNFVSFVMVSSEGEIVGMSMGSMGNMWCSPEIIFEEMAWYVDPLHRGKGSRMTLQLLYLLYGEAESRGATIFRATSELAGCEGVQKVYSRLGLVPTEIVHYGRLRTA